MPNWKKSRSAKKMTGAYRPDRDTSLPDGPQGNLPKAPSWLPTVGKRHWAKFAPLLHGLGLLSELDAGTFAMCCDLFADLMAAREELSATATVKGKRASFTYTTDGGLTKRHPLVPVVGELRRQYISVAVMFAMAPNARAKLGIDMTPEQEDPMARFLDPFRLRGPSRDLTDIDIRNRWPDTPAEDDDGDDEPAEPAEAS